MKIVIKRFGEINVRFCYEPKLRICYVCKGDILDSIVSLSDLEAQTVVRYIFENGIKDFIDADEKKSLIIDKNEIGLCLDVYSIGSLMHVISEMHDEPQANDILRETSFRMNALLTWFTEAVTQAGNEFGVEIMDILTAVKMHLDKVNPAFQVEVTQDGDLWIAECDALGIVTEAESFEELESNTWGLVPDLVALNQVDINPDDVRLSFTHTVTAKAQRAAY